MKAVIDGIVDGHIAVILVEECKKEFYYSADRLPPGAVEGSWLEMGVKNDEIISIQLDETTKREVSSRISEKMKQLRARGRKR